MERKANIIAVTSGKGGVGKSTIAVNLGILFAKRGKRVCLIDGDYGLANINLLLGLPAKKQPSDLFEKNFNPHKAMIKTEWGLDLLPSASGISQQQPLLAPSSAQVKRLIEKLIFDYDVILIDTSAGIGASVQNYLEVADQALLIINSEPTSLTDSFGLIRNMRNVQTSYNVLINRVKDEKTAKDIYKRFSVAVKKYIGVQVERLGYIQEDSFASAAILSQSPLVIYSANCNASQCFSTIVKNLIGQLQRKNSAQKLENTKSEDKIPTGKIELPETPAFINSSEDSFENWLLQMPSFLSREKRSGEHVRLSERQSHNFKQRKKKFISELGDLCLNDQSILEYFENMVIGKRIKQEEFGKSEDGKLEERLEDSHLKNLNNDLDGLNHSVNTKPRASSDKVVSLSEYVENKISM